jgi:glutaredoxin-related protein
MKRPLLPEDRVDPAIRDVISSNHRDIVDEVEAAVAGNAVVVVGMKQNPFPRRARKALTAAGIAFKYLEYGSYLSTWRRRTALKIWSGWPTFPMIFVKGVLIGGATEVQRLLDSGELARRLAAPARPPATSADNSTAVR